MGGTKMKAGSPPGKFQGIPVVFCPATNCPRVIGRLERAIAGVIAEGKNVTYDLKRGVPGTAVGTSQVADAVMEKLG